MKNNFRNCLSFWKKKLFSTKFQEQIIYYIINKIELSISTHHVNLRLVILIVDNEYTLNFVDFSSSIHAYILLYYLAVGDCYLPFN